MRASNNAITLAAFSRKSSLVST